MAATFPDDKKTDNMADKLGLNCPICLELIRDPKSLPCLHSFCNACLEEYTIKVSQDGKLQGAIDCPTCRKRCPVPTGITVDEWITRLSTSYALQHVVEYMSVNKGSEENDAILCEPCKRSEKEIPSTMFCKDCKQYQCDECVKIHGRFNMEWHKMVKFDILTKDELMIMACGQLENCEDDSKPLEFFCNEHAKLCCTTCSFSHHRFCKDVVTLARTELKENEPKPDDLNNQYYFLRNQLESTLRFFNGNEESMESQILSLQSTLQSVRKRLNDKMDAFEQKVLREAVQKQNERSAKYKNSRTRCDKLLAALNGTAATLNAVIRQGTPSQIFIATHKLGDQLVTYKQDAKEELSNLYYVTIKVKFGEHIERVLGEANEIGSLLTDTTPHTVESLLDYKSA